MTRKPGSKGWMGLLLVGATLATPALGLGQVSTDGIPPRAAPEGADSTHTFGDYLHPKEYGIDASGSTKPEAPEPYGGQIFCPVSGRKLGVTQAAVPVQTTFGEQQPTFFSRLLGDKGRPGMVIYTCCPACAEQVQRDPQAFLRTVISDRGRFAGVFSYANAPDRKPGEAPPGQDVAVQGGVVPASYTVATPPRP